MHSSWCSCDIVRLRTTWNNFFFAVHLPNILQEKGAGHSGRLFHLNIRWLMRKDVGESGPRNGTGALLKEQNHNFAERFIDSKLIAKCS